MSGYRFPCLSRKNSDDLTCGICHDIPENEIYSACGHCFCRACVNDYFGDVTSGARCPVCSKLISLDTRPGAVLNPPQKSKYAKRSILSRIDTSNFQVLIFF